MMMGHDVFLYTETVEDGEPHDEVQWFSNKTDRPLRLATEILVRAAAGEIGLRTLCLGFAEDYERMVPNRVTREPRGFGSALRFHVCDADEAENQGTTEDDADEARVAVVTMPSEMKTLLPEIRAADRAIADFRRQFGDSPRYLRVCESDKRWDGVEKLGDLIVERVPCVGDKYPMLTELPWSLPPEPDENTWPVTMPDNTTAVRSRLPNEPVATLDDDLPSRNDWHFLAKDEKTTDTEEKPPLPHDRPFGWFKVGDQVVMYARNNMDILLDTPRVVPVTVDQVVEGMLVLRCNERLHTGDHLEGHGVTIGCMSGEVMHEWELEYLQADMDFAVLYLADASKNDEHFDTNGFIAALQGKVPVSHKPTSEERDEHGNGD